MAELAVTVRDLLKRTPLRPLVLDARRRRAEAAWRRAGEVGPAPHSVKAATVREYADRYGLRVLVETGTYLGEMIEAQADHFDRLLTVELDDDLHAAARAKFAHRTNVSVLHGDSASVLPQMIDGLDEPALFWLDAHYSGGITAQGKLDTPVSAEIETVLGRNQPDVLLVDDARCFDGTNDYPTVDEFAAAVRSRRPDMDVTIRHDMFRITPAATSGPSTTP